jgi:glycosyltransferase involved in cell wall biosynthesis
VRVALLSTYDLVGGAARATYRLHQGLRAIGVDSLLTVQAKVSGDPSVLAPPGLPGRLGPLEARVRRFLHSLPVRLRRGRPPGVFTAAALPDRLAPRLAALAPDLVHLAWVADGFLRIESLPRLRRPLVWTLHDSWAFTGGCHVPYDCARYRERCGRCPALGSARERDLSRAVWERKERSWGSLDLTLVAPSRWLAEAARSSALLGGRRVEVIRNGLDLERFRPGDAREARASLGLPSEARVLLFAGVAALEDPNKGFPLLAAALGALGSQGWGKRLLLVVLGASAPAGADGAAATGVPIRYVGRVDDERRLALYYVAADALVAPSIQENQPNTVSEALACGTPCVAFRASGMVDLVEHEGVGYLARPYESADLARGIAWVLEDEGRRRALSERARRWALEELSLTRAAHKHLALYEEILGRRRAPGNGP